MSRWVFTTLAVLAVLWVLRAVGAVPLALLPLVTWILGTATSLASTFFILSLIYAPGIYRDAYDGLRHFFARIGTRGREVEELERKIAHLDKAHHRLQLGSLYMRQGRPAKARPWLEQALQREPGNTEAQFRLGLCLFEQGELPRAAELLRPVVAEKPDYDYGLASLRLAQALARTHQTDSAAEVFDRLLKFYPGQPEGSYSYSMLLADAGKVGAAQKLLREMVTAIRFSPRFQRRRNRHWVLKARWWLWRHRKHSTSGAHA